MTFVDASTERAFRAYLSKLERAHPEYVYGWSSGPRYAKIWRSVRGQASRSVVAFVDGNGDLYRADSWKARGRLLGSVNE